ncbi:MAG TPA: hypothetical protein VGS57_02010 [Thermoanaerobaculia bacterium]|nr:hypothetical protein [Thermoanaerobaculia bacterium]
MSALGWLAAPLVLVLLAAAGQPIAARLPVTRPLRLVLGFIAGALLLHALLSLLDLLGWRWRLAIALPFLLAAALIAFVVRARRPSRRSASFGWGDAVAILAVLGFAALAWTGWIAIPDFIYHWGLKGHRFLLEGHVDYGYLAQPLGWVFHPDYPNLYPELLAVTAMLAGWREGALLLWSPLLLALILISVREVLVAEGIPPFRRHAVVAFVALSCAGFAVANIMAGAADWFLALALAASLPALLAPLSTAADVQIGLCAALAGASKQEGLVMAVGLVAVQLSRWFWHGRRPRPAGSAALLVPPMLIVGYSWWRIAQHHLLQSYDKGLPIPSRLVATLRIVAEQLLAPEWHGFALLLLVLPLLLLVPRLRPFVAVALLHLAGYLASCAGQDTDTRLLVVTTFTRIVLQIFPATIAAMAVALFADGMRTAAAASGAAEASAAAIDA